MYIHHTRKNIFRRKSSEYQIICTVCFMEMIFNPTSKEASGNVYIEIVNFCTQDICRSVSFFFTLKQRMCICRKLITLQGIKYLSYVCLMSVGIVTDDILVVLEFCQRVFAGAVNLNVFEILKATCCDVDV